MPQIRRELRENSGVSEKGKSRLSVSLTASVALCLRGNPIRNPASSLMFSRKPWAIGLLLGMVALCSGAWGASRWMPPPGFRNSFAFFQNLVAFFGHPQVFVPVSPVASQPEPVALFIGSATVHPPLEPFSGPAAEPGKNGGKADLRVLSHNLWLLPFPFAVDMDGRLDRFCGFARDLGPDIVLLQEVWFAHHLEAVRRGFPGYWTVSSGGLGYNRSGLVILTKKPPKDALSGVFAVTGNHNFEELLARKGFLRIVLESGGVNWNIACTHLYASKTEAEKNEKFRQLRSLQGIIGSLTPPVLIGGDFNIRFEQFLPLNGDFLTLESSPPLPTNRNLNHPGKIDYLVGRAGKGNPISIDSTVLGDPIFSDHKMILATVTLELGQE